MAAFSTNTERLLTAFAGRPGVTADQVISLRNSIANSPPLTIQVDKAIAAGHLQHFVLLPPGSNAGGTYDGHSKTISLPASSLVATSSSLSRKAAELTFVLGHEVQHSFNHAATRHAYAQFELDLRTAATGRHDYTGAVGALLAANRRDEAASNIEGWNALVGMVKTANPEARLSDIYETSNRTRDFLQKDVGPPVAYAPRNGITLNADLSITATSANIEGMARHYFDKPAFESKLGHHGNSDYQNYYAAYAVGRACQYEVTFAAPGAATRMTINMTGLRLQERLLEENGIWLGEGTPPRQAYYDSSRHPPTLQHFDHSATTHTYVPIAGRESAGSHIELDGSAAPAQLLVGEGEEARLRAGPDRELHEQIRSKVAELDKANGRSFDATSERLIASLLVVAKQNGLDRVDHVVLSRQTEHHPAAEQIFVVKGVLGDPASLRAGTNTAEAAQRPVQESLDTLLIANHRQPDIASLEQTQRQVQEQQRGALSH
jgi:hypothetical protein